jgi:predicted acetyltransferase
MPELARVVGTSLAMPPSRFRSLSPDMTLCAFDDDRLATVHGSWPLTMRYNGKPIPISGVTTVSTDPIYRQRGHLRAVTTQHFQEMKEEGLRPLAVLFASQAAIYHRYGYDVVSTHHSYQMEPRYLQFVEPVDVPGVLREVDADKDFGLLVDIYRRFREDKTGYVHRGKPMWDQGVLAPPSGDDVRNVLVYEESGEALGFCSFISGPDSLEGPEPNQKLIVDDLAWMTPQAYHAFWQHFSKMALTRYITCPHVPGDDPLPHTLLEPRMLRDSARDGLLARVVDLVGSVDGRGYECPDERVTFELIDDLCTWNAGRWRVEVNGGVAATKSSNATADLTLSANTLAMILFGQISTSEAVRAGRIDLHDATKLPAWDATFKTRWAPFTPDNW